MAFKYACADFTFPLLPHDKVLKLISLLGFDGVDIGLFENRSHLQPSAVLGDPKKNGEKLGGMLADSGLCAADVFLQCDVDFAPKAINHPEESIRKEAGDYFKRMIDYALAAGSKHITCLPGVHFEGEAFDVSYGRALDELAWRIDAAKNAGLVFGVEAHLGSLIDTPKKAEAMVKQLSGLTLTLDYTHFTKIGMTDNDIEFLMPYATHFHARGAREGALQTVRSENTIDYARVIKKMREVNYPGFVGIEYIWMEWEGCNRSDNVSECIMLMDIMKKAEVEG